MQREILKISIVQWLLLIVPELLIPDGNPKLFTQNTLPASVFKPSHHISRQAYYITARLIQPTRFCMSNAKSPRTSHKWLVRYLLYYQPITVLSISTIRRNADDETMQYPCEPNKTLVSLFLSNSDNIQWHCIQKLASHCLQTFTTLLIYMSQHPHDVLHNCFTVRRKHKLHQLQWMAYGIL